jgi:hypothetical protein
MRRRGGPVAFVLSGGGSLGAVQVGVLRAVPFRRATRAAAVGVYAGSRSSSTTCIPPSTLDGNPSTKRDGFPSTMPVVRSKMSMG